MHVAEKGQTVEVELASIVNLIWFDQGHNDYAFFGEDQVVADVVLHFLCVRSCDTLNSQDVVDCVLDDLVHLLLVLLVQLQDKVWEAQVIDDF